MIVFTREQEQQVRTSVIARTLQQMSDVMDLTDSNVVWMRVHKATTATEVGAFAVARDFIGNTMTGLGPGPVYSLLLGIRGNLDYLIETR